MSDTYDLLVVGGGPAGYVAAIRGAQLGKKVACIEMERAGGTCLNWGCIPTKALLKNAEMYQALTHKAAEFGLSFDNLQYDWSTVVKRSRDVSGRLAGGIEFLFKKNKIDYIRGTASILEEGKVSVTDAKGAVSEYTGDNVIIATGCKARAIPNLPFDGKRIISSKEAMVLEEQPKSMVIIGAGAIGTEFAYIYNAFGTKVTIIEMQNQLLPVEDDEIGIELGKAFKKQGVDVRTSTSVSKTEVVSDGVELTLDKDGKSEVIKADICLVAIGVEPVMPEFAVAPLLERGYIDVGSRYETSLPNVYAVGDIAGPPWLAHVASFEATQCVEGLFIDGHQPRQVNNFPGCTYCHPQVASVGKTERTLKEEGVAYRVGKFPFQASGKAQAGGDTDGFVKLLFGEENHELLGAHIIGDNATELISEMGLALEMEACEEDIHSTIHAHPTLAEAIHEATLDAGGHAIHF